MTIYFVTVYAEYVKYLHNHWKGLLFRGILGVLFGIIAIGWPGIGLQILVLLFGAYVLIDGLVAFILGFPLRSVWMVIEGLLGILVGFLIFFYTIPAIAIFIYLVGIWAFVTGILEIIAAIELRKYVANEAWLLFTGIISIIFGIIIFANPIAAGIAISLIIGIYALLFGMLLIILALQLKDVPSSKSKSAKKKRR